MGNLKALAGQTAIYGVSTIVTRFLSYMLNPYLTRILTPEEFGVINDFYAIIPFMLVLLTMGMETGYFRFTGKAGSLAEKNNVFRTTWGAVDLVSTVFMILVVLFYRKIAVIMEYPGTPWYILIVGSIIFLDTIAAVPFARLREQGKAYRYMTVRLAMIITTVILTLFFYSVMPRIGSLSFLYHKEYLPVYYLIANLASSVIALPLLYPAYKGLTPKIDFKLFKIIFFYSLPLLLSGIANTANDFIDRQFIKYLMPSDSALSQLGIYAAVVKIGVVMILFVQMYRIAAEPFFLSNFKKEEFGKLNAEAMKYFIMVSVFIFLVIALFPEVFQLLIGADYREGIYILPVVLCSNILSGVVLNLSFWYKQTGKTNIALIITFSGLMVTAVLNIILIPQIGYLGAALARLACEIVMVTISYSMMQKYYPIPYDIKRIGSYFLAGGILYGMGLLAEGLPYLLKFTVDAILLSLFLIFAVKKENLDVRGLLKSIIKNR
ncbi:MAG: oligosaccharide flippase family protein [Rikenellaceae bacterium]|nr:oligosaccharide flippase family protein [Rikenellaceae bacterium]